MLGRYQKYSASEMTYTVSGGALNSTQSNPLSEIHAKTDQHCRAEDCLAIDME